VVAEVRHRWDTYSAVGLASDRREMVESVCRFRDKIARKSSPTATARVRCSLKGLATLKKGEVQPGP
jgi:hypothetical protein